MNPANNFLPNGFHVNETQPKFLAGLFLVEVDFGASTVKKF